jgi:hypothetical protein
MRFHDFHLAAYSVSDFGATIVLDLVYDHPEQHREISHIKFSDVAAYHFIHTGGAIILDIAEIPVATLINGIGDELSEWWRLHGGYIHWREDRLEYVATLEEKGYRAWTIGSAVGFEGFVVAKAVGDGL